MNDIVCMSTSNWHPFPTRKQQVMGRVKVGRILYFDPPISRAAPFKDPQTAGRLRQWKSEGEPVTDSVTVYATPPVWPMFNRYPEINRHNQKKISRFVREMMTMHGFVDPVLWCYSPTSVDLVDHVPHSALVYDCVDRHSAYGGMMNPKVVDDMEKRLAEKANVVFATAQGLYDTLKQYNDNTFLVPNGANFELFNRAAGDELPFPDGLFNIQNPIFGFVGMLQHCIDLDLLLYLADQRPDWSFVLIGKAHPGVDTAPLLARKNIHILGIVPHKELPAYLARFNVCLNMFRTGDLARDVSPLKFYEYLATGKPIVTTAQPEQVRAYADAVYIAENHQEFLEKASRALTEKSAWMKNQRISYGKAASWDVRVEEMTKILKDKGVFE